MSKGEGGWKWGSLDRLLCKREGQMGEMGRREGQGGMDRGGSLDRLTSKAEGKGERQGDNGEGEGRRVVSEKGREGAL